MTQLERESEQVCIMARFRSFLISLSVIVLENMVYWKG